jgi:hypothetical protein
MLEQGNRLRVLEDIRKAVPKRGHRANALQGVVGLSAFMIPRFDDDGGESETVEEESRDLNLERCVRPDTVAILPQKDDASSTNEVAQPGHRVRCIGEGDDRSDNCALVGGYWCGTLTAPCGARQPCRQCE